LANTSCEFCRSTSLKHLTDCYDQSGSKVCELWFCLNCRRFLPDNVADHVAVNLPELPDRRRHHRFNISFVIELIVAGNHHGPIVATVVNASHGGVCFLFPEPIAEGTEGRFRISLPSAPRSFEAKGKIVRCIRAEDGSHGIAVNFIEVDPDYRAHLERYVKLSALQPDARDTIVKEITVPLPAGDSLRAIN
jgi:hypothetical protein